jgi:hypothetical protein
MSKDKSKSAAKPAAPATPENPLRPVPDKIVDHSESKTSPRVYASGEAPGQMDPAQIWIKIHERILTLAAAIESGEVVAESSSNSAGGLYRWHWRCAPTPGLPYKPGWVERETSSGKITIRNN